MAKFVIFGIKKANLATLYKSGKFEKRTLKSSPEIASDILL